MSGYLLDYAELIHIKKSTQLLNFHWGNNLIRNCEFLLKYITN